MKKDDEINLVLDSLNNIKRAEPSPFLFPKILNRLKNPSAANYLSPRKIALGLVSIALLGVMNVSVLLYAKNQNEQYNYQLIKKEYFQSTTDNYNKILE